MGSMGLDFGLEGNGKFCKRKFRYLLKIDDVCADGSPGAKALPPLKSARPNIGFKEMNPRHLIEDVYYPAKPDWKPVSLILYDLQVGREHPVFEWLKEFYDPREGKLFEPNANDLLKEARLELYNGCGEPVETWIWEEVWPQNVNFQELDMGDNGVVLCEVQLRYARAYVERA